MLINGETDRPPASLGGTLNGTEIHQRAVRSHLFRYIASLLAMALLRAFRAAQTSRPWRCLRIAPHTGQTAPCVHHPRILLQRNKAILASTVALLLAGCCVQILGQSISGSAAIEGTVLDPSEASVASAEVSIHNEDTGYQRRLLTDKQGRFSASPLPVGRYLLRIESAGFHPQSIGPVQLTVGRTEAVRVRLQLLSFTTQVNVSAEQENTGLSNLSSTSLIPSQLVSGLPIRGRQFAEFIQLSPAVVQEQDRFGLVVAGQRSINSNISIDGTDFNDPLQGNQRGGNESAFFFPQSAIREFEVVRAGASAEIGRTSAGFVNAVTQSGTNDLHGELFYFNRNRHLTSKDAFGRRLNNGQNQFGGAVGGALVRERAFYFLSGEQNFLRVPFVVEFDNQAGLPPELAARQGEFRGTNNPTALFARTDFILNAAHSLTVDASYSRLRGENFNFDSPRLNQSAERNFSRQTRSHAVKAALTSVRSANSVNELRVQLATDFRLEQPNSLSPEIVISGIGAIGGDSGRPRRFDAQRYEVTDSLNWVRGAHTVRLGADLNVTPARQQREANIQGRWDFRSLADYLAIRPNRFRQTLPGAGFTPGDLVYAETQQEFALFLSDKIALKRNVSLTMGLRWEGQWNPDPERAHPSFPETGRIPDDLAMWQPRLGLAWDVSGRGSTVLRFSSGIYAARTPATLFQRVFTDNGTATELVDLRSAALQSAAPPLTFPNVFSSVPPAGLVASPRIFGFDPNFHNPRTFQAAGTLEQSLPGQFVLSAEYLLVNTWGLQRRLDRNLFPPSLSVAGVPVFPASRPRQGAGRFSVNESSAHSSFHGLILSLVRRLGGRLQMQAHYTLSQTRDDDSNERNFSLESALNPFDLQSEVAFSKQDVRHNFNVSGLLQLSRGFSVSTILSTRTGLPYTAVVGTDGQNDENEDNDRPVINGVVAGRNTFRQPGFASLDLRLLKAFDLGEAASLQIMGEVFNLTRNGNKNFGNDGISQYGTGVAPFPSFGVPLFAPSTARLGGPRQIQLGLRFRF
jgi:Carboxypeptidase regulatory-like domain